MKLLAFDTSATACSVALLKDNEVSFSHQVAPMKQAKLILPAIDELLQNHALELNDLDAIAYGAGPGSFTGIRIAASVAQGLGFAAKKPLIAISSLAAMAQAAFMERQWEDVLVAVDARMDHIYWAQYKVNSSACVELQGEEHRLPPEWASMPHDEAEWYGVGDGWAKYKDKLMNRLKPQLSTIYACQLPTAKAILELAKPKLAKGEFLSIFEALPVYLR
jgi:tRNA threonylcarbamoyladenosine biosynthesis protein TsaB